MTLPPPPREERGGGEMMIMSPALLDKYSQMLVHTFEKKVDELILSKSRTASMRVMMEEEEEGEGEGR